MYKVLLVDDERMILEGISKIVDWESQGVTLIGKKMNGIEAMEFLEKNQTDIVITDITMPGLDGIGLVAKAKDKYPDIKWIFLTGFSEFEYARQAMRYGVKHYLLKPCNEEQISEALHEIVQEKKNEEATYEYFQSIEKDAHKLHDYECEEILNRFLVYRQLSEEMKSKLIEMLNVKFDRKDVCFIVVYLENETDYAFLQRVAESYQYISDNLRSVYTIIDNSVVIMQEYTFPIENTIKNFHDYLIERTDRKITMILSKKYCESELLQSEFGLDDAINQSFYAQSGDVITSHDWLTFNSDVKSELDIDLDKIILFLKQENMDAANRLLDEYCSELFVNHIHPSKVKIYFVQMYLLILSKFSSHVNEDRMETITALDNFIHLNQFQKYFTQFFERLIENGKSTRRYSQVVKQMIVWIEKEIENPELTLQWLGSNCMFMNADYLGKIFKKEVGQRFSAYVTNARVNRAVEIIKAEEDVKVFELAERMGFGNNPQYFSQLFKRVKGYTPSEIMRTYE